MAFFSKRPFFFSDEPFLGSGVGHSAPVATVLVVCPSFGWNPESDEWCTPTHHI